MDQIKTKAGRELFKYMNENWGSIVWGPVLKGIIEIEREAMITCCNANVVHNIYPDGMRLPDNMMRTDL